MLWSFCQVPYRQKLAASCTDCSKISVFTCIRCDCKQCELHRPAKQTPCCLACETLFVARTDRRSTNAAIFASVVTVVFYIVFVVSMASYFSFIPVIGLSALLVAPVVALGTRGLFPRYSRKAFLKEREQRVLSTSERPKLLRSFDND